MSSGYYLSFNIKSHVTLAYRVEWGSGRNQVMAENLGEVILLSEPSFASRLASVRSTSNPRATSGGTGFA